ncbi:MAG: NAD(P)/FAD-dependent oxidoreductase [Nitrososphaerota archaeon]
MLQEYDVVVAGGSISGLASARELAGRGYNVIVLEEDMEIGTPEKCGGLVSLNSFSELALAPSERIIAQHIERAILTSPSGKEIEMNVKGAKVVSLKRRELDKAMATAASRNGAVVQTGIRMNNFIERDETQHIETSLGKIQAKYLVDARGISVYKSFVPEGLLPVAQYEVYLPDIQADTVEVHVDKKLSKEYFLWVIPISHDTARVGIAGKGQLATKLEDYLSKRKASVTKKIYHSLAIGGAIKNFVSGRRIIAGEAAGQTKPTTAGGIYTAGLGGRMAGKYLSDALQNGYKELDGYQKEWMGKFGSDFAIQSNLRKIYEDLDNEDIDTLFSILKSSRAVEALSDASFDFHGADLRKLFDVKDFLKSLNVLGRSRTRIKALLQLAVSI